MSVGVACRRRPRQLNDYLQKDVDLYGIQVIAGDAEAFQDGLQCPDGQIAPMPWNDRRAIEAWVMPYLMAAFGPSLQLAPEATQLAGELSISHAGTQTGTRLGVLTVSMPRGRGWPVSTITAIRS